MIISTEEKAMASRIINSHIKRANNALNKSFIAALHTNNAQKNLLECLGIEPYNMLADIQKAQFNQMVKALGSIVNNPKLTPRIKQETEHRLSQYKVREAKLSKPISNYTLTHAGITINSFHPSLKNLMFTLEEALTSESLKKLNLGNTDHLNDYRKERVTKEMLVTTPEEEATWANLKNTSVSIGNNIARLQRVIGTLSSKRTSAQVEAIPELTALLKNNEEWKTCLAKRADDIQARKNRREALQKMQREQAAKAKRDKLDALREARAEGKMTAEDSMTQKELSEQEKKDEAIMAALAKIG